MTPTHRMRRGVLVEIPAEWRGQTVHKQTLRKRKVEQVMKRKAQNPKYRGAPTVAESSDEEGH